MDKFIGTWKLETNENFDEFLTYYGYSWLGRQAALASNIDLTIEKPDKEHVIKRIVDSTFMKADELYIFDGNFYINQENLKKKHTFEDNCIISEVKGDSFEWNEKICIENDKMIIKRTWSNNGTEYICSQVFSKY